MHGSLTSEMPGTVCKISSLLSLSSMLEADFSAVPTLGVHSFLYILLPEPFVAMFNNIPILLYCKVTM